MDGLYVLRRIRTVKRGCKISLWIGGIFSALALILVALAVYWFISMPSFLDMEDSPVSWTNHLPETATEVNEWAWADGFLPDYSYILKAKVTQQEFNEFNLKLGLTPHTPTRIYTESDAMLSWNAPPGCDEAWWDPSPFLDATFVEEGSDTWSCAKYEDGFLYFQSLNH